MASVEWSRFSSGSSSLTDWWNICSLPDIKQIGKIQCISKQQCAVQGICNGLFLWIQKIGSRELVKWYSRKNWQNSLRVDFGSQISVYFCGCSYKPHKVASLRTVKDGFTATQPTHGLGQGWLNGRGCCSCSADSEQSQNMAQHKCNEVKRCPDKVCSSWVRWYCWNKDPASMWWKS